MAEEVADDYRSSLGDLTFNSKPIINMLTMIAEENKEHAPAVVQVIEEHIKKVSQYLNFLGLHVTNIYATCTF